jgi:hypothetical protein
LNVLGYTTGIEKNDTTFRNNFPYVQIPWSGYGLCTGGSVVTSINPGPGLNIGAPQLLMKSFPNPGNDHVTIRYRVNSKTKVSLKIYDSLGKIVSQPLTNQLHESGTYDYNWTTSDLNTGVYYIVLLNNNETVQSLKTSIIR